MNIPLEINEQLAKALQATTISKSMILSFLKEEEKMITKRVDTRSVAELDEILCDVINRITSLVADVLACDALSESEKQILDSQTEDVGFVQNDD